MEKRAALIEFNTWHQECLYSQLRVLKENGYRVWLVGDIRKRTYIETLVRGMEVSTLFYDFKKLSSFVKLRSYLIKNNVEDIILNTAQGSGALKFTLLPFPTRFNIVGTLHNLGKLRSSFGQKIIARKIKRYYLLSEYLRASFPLGKGLDCAVFAPYHEQGEVIEASIDKGEEIWVCVPGGTDANRRDYEFLIRSASLMKGNERYDNVRLILLGNSRNETGQRLREEIERLGLGKYFVMFDKFIEPDVFAAYLRRCDYLVPLIHPGIKMAESYTKFRVSGTFIMAQTFSKNMLCHEMFSQVGGFEYPSFYYSDEKEFLEKAMIPAPTISYHLNNEKYNKNYLSLLK